MGVGYAVRRDVSHSAAVCNTAVAVVVLLAIVTLLGGGMVMQRTISCRGVKFTRVVRLLLVLLLLRRWW